MPAIPIARSAPSRISRARRVRRLALATAALLAGTGCLSGCTGGTASGDDPARAADQLAAGLSAKNLTGVEFIATPSADIDQAFKTVVRGMGPLAPEVKVEGVDRSGSGATANLTVTWSFPGVPEKWTYDTTAQLQNDAGRWKTAWQDSIVQPDLNGSTRLSQRRQPAPRGEILGAAGEVLVSARPVVRIGIDKSALAPATAQSSAIQVARLVGIDQQAYAKRVAKAGPDAFVEAITLRANDPKRPTNKAVFAIPGALPIQGTASLAPSRDFARPILGTVGEATKEIVDKSSGAVVAGDQVGLSGLQRRYDPSLRGTPGAVVRLLPKTSGSTSPTPTATNGATTPPSTAQPTAGQSAAAATTPAPTPAPGQSNTPDPVPPVLFEAKPVAGQDLQLTLDRSAQQLAESALAQTRPASAIVAIQPSTGAILAAANGPGNNGQNLATAGQAAPGSTFKVVSALALLRAGASPSAPLSCPASITVDGRKFTNYSDYPSGSLGKIDLRTALAKSCNTAFIGARTKLGPGELAAAAASLGLGIDHNTGFPSYFGSVPDNPKGTAQAAAMIGQGTVLASPMVMAAVAASVAAGHTVTPVLVTTPPTSATAAPDAPSTPGGPTPGGPTPGGPSAPASASAAPGSTGPSPSAASTQSPAKPLTADEAKALRSMMSGVVANGSGKVLADLPGPPVLAKTGTAEFGSRSPLQTHTWMIAAQGDLAVAVFVDTGKSGSRTSGPLLHKFLAGMH